MTDDERAEFLRQFAIDLRWRLAERRRQTQWYLFGVLAVWVLWVVIVVAMVLWS